MATTQLHVSCWDRLQDVLVSFQPGDIVTPNDLVTETGLSRQMATTVLEALARADLFERADDGVFVRRRLQLT